jgi:hypothetical protein
VGCVSGLGGIGNGRARKGRLVSFFFNLFTNSRSLNVGRFGHNEPDREAWKRAHQLFVQALQDPSTEADKKKLARILKKPIPAHVTSALFDYDNFLRGLGRMSLSK